MNLNKIFYILLISSNALGVFENKPKTTFLYNTLINNIRSLNIIPLGLLMWSDYKDGKISRDEVIKEHYKRFMIDIDKKKYALIYNKVNEDYLNKIKSNKDHPVDLFPRTNNDNYWKSLAYTLAELYSQTEFCEDQNFDFLENNN